MGKIKVNADLHNHLRNRSDMSGINFKRLLRKVSKRLGENGVFGIINFGDNRAEQSFEQIKRAYGDFDDFDHTLYVPQERLWIVKGQEVPAMLDGGEVHILAVGLPQNKHLKNYKSLDYLLKESKDNGAITIDDHPFHFHGLGHHLERNPGYKEKFLPEINGWEVYNTEAALSLRVPLLSTIFPPRANERALAYYEEHIRDIYDIGATEGTDGHSLGEAAKAHSLIEIPPHTEIKEDNFLQHLRQGITENKTYSGRKPTSRIKALSHATVVVWDHAIKPRIWIK